MTADGMLSSASAQGKVGPVAVSVLMDQEGTIQSLTIGDENYAETPEYAAAVQEDAFISQFIGKKAPFALSSGNDAAAGDAHTASSKGFAGPVAVQVAFDDAGATALAVYGRHLSEADPEVLCVVNMYRSLTRTAEDALSVMKEIEQMARIKVTGIVNNSHLKQRTTWEHISESLSFAEDVARMADVPLKFITVPKSVNHLNKIDKIYPVDVYVKAPWE